MRKILALLIMLTALHSASAAITLSLINPSQYPLESNQGFTMTVTAYNPEVLEFDDLKIGLDLSYPYLPISGETYLKNVGDLSSKTMVLKSFRLKTYDDVLEGDYPLRIYYCAGNCDAKVYNDISLQFTGSFDVRLVNYSFSKSTIVPEEEFEVTLSIKNFGTAKARDVSVQINNSIQGLIPFIFTGKANNYYLGDLESDSITSIVFKMLINEELTPGVYSVPVIVNTASQSLNVGNIVLDLSAKSELVIPLVETEPLTSVLGKPLTVIATLENIGPGDAKSVVAVLEVGSERVSANYIGKVESSDDDVALFDIVQREGKDFVVRVTYTDDLGEHEVIKTFSVDYEVVVDTAWLNNLVFLGVLIVAGFIIYKKKYAKKKKE
jgi:hypothetical protein